MKYVWIVVGVLILASMSTYVAFNTFDKLTPFVKRWEGGLSRALTDTASSHPSPYTHNGKTGWHTSRGITYQTFLGARNVVGYKDTYENFIKMPDWIWSGVAKKVFWEMYPLDKLKKFPRIQAVIFSWAWGSGGGGSERQFANFQREIMGIKDSNITKKEIVENFASRLTRGNELDYFNLLCDWRSDFFKSLNQPANLKGWLNRLADFRKTFS